MSEPLMSRNDLQDFLQTEFAQVADQFEVVDVASSRASLRLRVGKMHLRPGGTVSGPAMFGLADVAAYLAILAMVGPKALAVTTSASIDFMRKPPAGADVVAQAEVLKLGRALAIVDLRLHSVIAPAQVVCRATMTYSLPKS